MLLFNKLSKEYLKTVKDKDKSTDNQILRWLLFAFSSGDYDTLLLIIKDFL
jgi:hypothetical protein